MFVPNKMPPVQAGSTSALRQRLMDLLARRFGGGPNTMFHPFPFGGPQPQVAPPGGTQMHPGFGSGGSTILHGAGYTIGGGQPGTFQGTPADVLSSVSPPVSANPAVTHTLSMIGPNGQPVPNSPFAGGFSNQTSGGFAGPNFQIPAGINGMDPAAIRQALIQRVQGRLSAAPGVRGMY